VIEQSHISQGIYLGIVDALTQMRVDGTAELALERIARPLESIARSLEASGKAHELKAQRDELLEALKPTIDALDIYAHWLRRGGDGAGAESIRGIRDTARAAIEKATGGD